MTNWNDGTIHGWNGGDCPVHPETVVQVWTDGGSYGECRAGKLRWKHKKLAGDIIAFRVVKPYVEPRVIWVNEYKTGAHIARDTEALAKSASSSAASRSAVKYVECKE